MDKPIAALIKDLKDRGLFDETLLLSAVNLAVRHFVKGAHPKEKYLVGIIFLTATLW